MTGPDVVRDRDVSCRPCGKTWTVYGTGAVAVRSLHTHDAWHHGWIAESRARQEQVAA